MGDVVINLNQVYLRAGGGYRYKLETVHPITDKVCAKTENFSGFLVYNNILEIIEIISKICESLSESQKRQ